MTKNRNLAKPSNSREIDAFLDKVASTPTVFAASSSGRLIFALDATASREPTWDRACQIQGEMFSETEALGGLEVQMAYYRGYGAFNATPWIRDSKSLVGYMTGVHCSGGRTQIERVLEHALAETTRRKVNALIFIGDCVEEDVDGLCSLAGKLGLMGVPVFIFQEGDEPMASSAFRQIADISGGAHCSFDSSSARQLRDLLAAVAVYAAGGRKALENYSARKGGDALLITRQVK